MTHLTGRLLPALIAPTTRHMIVMVIGLLAAINTHAYELAPLWQLENQFSMPESAVIDTARGYVYVSNVNTYARDDNGFVSRVTLDGARVDHTWVSGLHSPTGMAIVESTLYVADFDALVAIDLDTATILSRYPAPDPSPALNDVAVAATGEVYVSGSASNSIYQLQDGELTVWKHDDALLLRANGLLVQDYLLIHGGAIWNVFDRASGKLQSSALMPEPSTRNIDGITADGCGGYLFTLIDDARIHRLTRSGQTLAVSDTSFDGIDLQLVGSLLAVPQVGGGLSLFEIDTQGCANITLGLVTRNNG